MQKIPSKGLKILSVFDIHTPYNIPLNPVLDFCSDWQPDIVQYGGDTTSAESCNWRKITTGLKRDVQEVVEDYDILKRVVLDPFNKAKPKNSETVYHIGNHEGWFYEAMAMDTRAGHKYGIEDNIDLKKYKMRLVKENGIVNWGYLYFTHSTYLNDSHAKKTALNYRKCLIYGHSHDIQSYTIHSPIDAREKIIAKSCGCLCSRNPDYLEGKPNKWINAFHIAYIRPDGTFNDFEIVITDGKFTAPNGRVYQ